MLGQAIALLIPFLCLTALRLSIQQQKLCSTPGCEAGWAASQPQDLPAPPNTTTGLNRTPKEPTFGCAEHETPGPAHAGALNLSQYTGLWGGKWCSSAFDPPAPANATAKPQCPQLDMAVAPTISPVLLPAIDSLSNGTLGAMRNGTKQPLVIKACLP